MGVPLLDLRLQYASIRDEVRRAIDELCESQQFILGRAVQELEREIAAYSQVRFAIGVSSGTDALLLAMMAAGIEPGDEVITTPFTFFATAGCIARLGAKPVFVDIDPETYNIDPRQIRAAITDKSRAIIPVHLYGQCADMDPIMALAEKHKLCVIEDAAQAIGAKYKGRLAGGLGHIGCFSFYPSKNLGGFGDGGMVTSNDEALAERMKLLRVHGDLGGYDHQFIGGNFRLDSLQAAVLRVKLARLDNWHSRRRENAERYNRLFAGSSVVFPKIADYNESNFNYYCIQVDQRDKVLKHLRGKNIGCCVYYPKPLHLQTCFAYLGGKKGDFPISERVAERILAIPIYPELTAEQIDEVVDAILEVC
jgi:dTDP-4-amino-4,6-dideoxygalactose transaminase